MLRPMCVAVLKLAITYVSPESVIVGTGIGWRSSSLLDITIAPIALAPCISRLLTKNPRLSALL